VNITEGEVNPIATGKWGAGEVAQPAKAPEGEVTSLPQRRSARVSVCKIAVTGGRYLTAETSCLR
jgi:hypothetical protein